MSLWEANIPEVPYGIPSYVHRVRVGYILSWEKPAIFGRILKTSSSLESLAMDGTDIEPLGGLLDPASPPEFGKKLTSLSLFGMARTFVAIISLIFSFPNLENLSIKCAQVESGRTTVIVPDTSIGRPLRRLVFQQTLVIGPALVRCQLTCNSLTLDVCDNHMVEFIAHSSETMVTLSLHGLWSVRASAVKRNWQVHQIEFAGWYSGLSQSTTMHVFIGPTYLRCPLSPVW